jgi:hypothetical protein
VRYVTATQRGDKRSQMAPMSTLLDRVEALGPEILGDDRSTD